jgi:N6-adenosine-specific RNA methylase IME4
VKFWRESSPWSMNVSRRTVMHAASVRDDGVPELAAAVVSGEVAVSAAAAVATLPADEQHEIVARGEDEILRKAAEIRIRRRDERVRRNAVLASRKIALPEQTYSCIVADPPWAIQWLERDVRPNQVGLDYPTMTEVQLAEFDMARFAAPDCHLFLWTTHTHLPVAFRLLDVWGFTYSCAFTWLKNGGFQVPGQPQQNTEFALYGRRGSPKFRDTKQFFTGFSAKRRGHSRKPDEFYDVIRRVCDGPRIDVFSRERRDGFEQYGNEVDKFSSAEEQAA